MTIPSRRTIIVCLIGLGCAFAAITLLFCYALRNSNSVQGINAERFQGRWVSDPVMRGNLRLTARIRFIDEKELVFDSHSTGPEDEKVYPGPSDLYRYSRRKPGVLLVTLVSRTFDDRDISTSEDRVAQEWHYWFEGDGVLRIEKPSVAGQLNYLFRRDE